MKAALHLIMTISLLTGCSTWKFVHGQSYPVDTIQYQGDPGKYINLVFLGDGFDGSELDDFHANAQDVAEYLFSFSPFTEYRNYFNVFAIRVTSPESGTDHPGTASDVTEPVFPVESVNTYFNGTFDYAAIHRLLVATNGSAVNAVINASFPLSDQVMILVNSPHYGGSGGSRAVASLHSSAAEIMIHELGHSFAGLADEYYAGDQYAGERANMTAQTNPNLVKWKNWIGEHGIGIYQHCCGGNSAEWYRPHENCKMRFLGAPFCAVCKETITERIHEIIGIPISESFPAENVVDVCGDSLHLGLAVIAPIPNTLEITWKVNEVIVASNVDFLALPTTELNIGTNTVTAELFDQTPLTRADDHAVDHTYTRTWTIHYEPMTPPLVTPTGPLSVCEGTGAVTLTCASQGVAYAWSTGDTTQSIEVMASGSYAVTVTNAYGCSAPSEAVGIEFRPAPEIEILEGPLVGICPGDTTTLSAPSGFVTYLWTTGATDQHIDVDMPGFYRLTVTDAYGCPGVSEISEVTWFDTSGVEIHASGDLEFCLGDSIRLSATGGPDVLWNTGDTTQSLLVFETGDYQATVVTESGCVVSTQAVTVEAHLPPLVTATAMGPNPHCPGDTVMITASLHVRYLWNTGDTTRILITTAGGIFNCVATDSFGCQGISPEVVITRYPVDTPAILVTGTTLTCSVLSGVYSWSFNGVPIAGADSIAHEAEESGWYTVSVRDSFGCLSVSEPIQVIVSLTKQAELPLLQIVPNPGSGYFRLDGIAGLSGQLSVFTTLGTLIVPAQDAGEIIDISGFPAGIYLVVLRLSGRTWTGKVVMQ